MEIKKRGKDKKQKSFVLKSIQKAFASLNSKLNVAVALLFILVSSMAYAGDVVVQNGQLNVNDYLNVDASGNIGINTTAPASHLEVRGAGNQSIRVTSTDVNRTGIYFSRPGAAIDWSVENYFGALRFRYSPDDFASLYTKMIVFPSGKVGINTITPESTLTVRGTLNVSDIVNFGRLSNCNLISADENGFLNCGAGGGGAGIITSSPWNSTSNNIYLNDSTAKVGIGIPIPSTKLHVKNTGSASVIVADSGDGATSQFSAVDFYDNNAPKWGLGKNPAGDFYIDQSGIGRAITIRNSDKNVGIGDLGTNPRAPIHVTNLPLGGSETNLAILQSMSSLSNTATSLRITNSVGLGLTSGSAEISALRTNTVTNGDTDLIFRTSAGSTLTPRIRIIGSSGSVGIGTETPDPNAKLEVAGKIKITDGTQGANKVLTSNADGLASWQASSSGLPSGASGQTLRHDGTNWASNGFLTISDTGDISWTGTLQNGNVPWARINLFPTACPAGQYVTGVGGTLTCAAPSLSETDPTVKSWAKTDTPTIPGVVNAVCPSGMTDAGRFCIETAERGSASWWNAIDSCGNAGRRLCSVPEWYYACNNFALTDEIDDYEWTGDKDSLSSVIRIGLNSCSADSAFVETQGIPYRCCVDKRLSAN